MLHACKSSTAMYRLASGCRSASAARTSTARASVLGAVDALAAPVPTSSSCGVGAALSTRAHCTAPVLAHTLTARVCDARTAHSRFDGPVRQGMRGMHTSAGASAASEDGEAVGGDAAAVEADVGSSDFHSYGLSPLLTSSLERAQVEKLFPVQISTLQATTEEHDVIVRSRTGTGKTLAFVLPIAQRLIDDAPSRPARRRPRQRGGPRTDFENGQLPRALVLAPTRELALQVTGEFERFAPFLTTTTVYVGGVWLSVVT